jgi:uncharacterized membrane protein SpoIIM required for sporulation
MKETQFVARREEEWLVWDRWLAERWQPPAGTAKAERPATISWVELPRSFRRLCQDLALARHRQYSAPLQEALNRRVLTAHQRIYSARGEDFRACWRFLGHGFPRLVRSQWRPVLTAAAMLLLPFVASFTVIQFAPDATYLVLPPEMVGEIEEMYAPDAEQLGRPALASTAWMMWGLYVANNVRIDFQCFAGGIAFGLGSVFFLVYNGLYLGAIAGHLTRIGYTETFWGFVAGHSALELTGAILAGGAGLRLGLALVAPGARPRPAALVDSGRVAVRLLFGAAVLTFLAAFVEAFWSPLRAVPVSAKYIAGGALWVLLLVYLGLGGRGGDAA